MVGRDVKSDQRGGIGNESEGAHIFFPSGLVVYHSLFCGVRD